MDPIIPVRMHPITPRSYPGEYLSEEKPAAAHKTEQEAGDVARLFSQVVGTAGHGHWCCGCYGCCRSR